MRRINLLMMIVLFAASSVWAENFPLFTQKKYNAFYQSLEQKVPYPEHRATAELNDAIAQLEGSSEAVVSVEKNKALGIYYHALAVRKDGRRRDAEQSEKYFQKALDMLTEIGQEKSAIANNLRGWLGGACALKPKFGLSIFETIKVTNQGTSLLDRSIYNDPEDLELRFLRANTYIYFPKFLGKIPTVVQDLEYLLSYFGSYYQEKSDVVLKIYALLSYAYKENGSSAQSKYYSRKLQEIAPDSEYARRAKEQCGI